MSRRTTRAVTLAAAIAGAACDGDAGQTSQTASVGSLWNTGDSPVLVPGDGAAPTTGICSDTELQQQWAAMVSQPIVPPYLLAGVNLAGWTVTGGSPATSWQGVTIEQVENGIGGALYPVAASLVPAGTTLPQVAPTRLCQGQNLGQGGNSGDVAGGTQVTAFGENAELELEWSVDTHKAYFARLNAGYSGTMTWTWQQPQAPVADPTNPCVVYGGCDGKLHSYAWSLTQPITDDGETYEINWELGDQARVDQQVDVLYRGLTRTYAPDLYDDLAPGVPCTSTGRCTVWPASALDGVHPEVGFRTISMYWVLNPSAQPQPSGSTPSYAYIFNVEYAPYSPAVSTLDMSTSTGPSARLDPIGDMGKACSLALGDTFGALGDDCIDVFQSQTTDTLAMARVLGSMTHDDQSFAFALAGIQQSYRPPDLDVGGARQFDVIHDGDAPPPDAVAVDFTLDVRAFGAIQNDTYPTTTTGVWSRDDHGAGAVFREFGRMVQEDLAGRYAKKHGTTPRALHDPACLFPAGDAWSPPPPADDAGTLDAGQADATGDASGDATGATGPQQWQAAPGCTGFEGWIDEAYPNVWAYGSGTAQMAGQPVDPSDATRTDPANVFDVGFELGSLSNGGLRPGTPYALFCMDPGSYDFCGAPSLYGESGDLLDASLRQVVQIMGNGDAGNLPAGVGDRRYFFMMYGRALAKYLLSGAALHTGACGGPVSGQPRYCADSANAAMAPVPYFGDYRLDTDDMFFDSFGASGGRSEVVNFAFADLTHDPMGFSLSALLASSNWREARFYQRLDREERALFMAMQSEDSKQAGQAAWALTRGSDGGLVDDEWGWPRKNADVFLTNLAGSPAIAAGPWVGVPNPVDGGAGYKPIGASNQLADPCFPTTPPAQVGKSPWYCATHLDPDCPAQAPTNDDGTLVTRDNGEPLLAGYCGIWNPTAFALGSSRLRVITGQPGSHLTAQQGQSEHEAEVLVPSYANPYDLTSARTPIDVLVPWEAPGPGNGFAVPSSTAGQAPLFVQTASLDFSGQIITPVIDYRSVPATDGGSSDQISIQAYRAGDFLGDLFLCYDATTAASRAGTGRPGDILAVHMDSAVADIINWLANHPGAQSDCAIVIRYGTSASYPDAIAAVASGVSVDIAPGQASGRVIDATLFVPGSGSAPTP